ncbi:hypothetical protein P8605_06995 [Streptomyces sp. T-3]|nr:hypothetical protein [Streptomyces sp. T-3]
MRAGSRVRGSAKEGKVDYGVAPIPGKTGPLDSTLGVADLAVVAIVLLAFIERHVVSGLTAGSVK